MKKVEWTVLIDEDSTVTADEWIGAARAYIGTPYMTQGRTKIGMDCGGMLLAPAADLKLSDLIVEGYSNHPDGKTYDGLLAKTLRRLKKNEKTRVGDVVACDFGEGIQHVAIVTELEPRLKVIHAVRQHGVVEQYLYGRYLRAWTATFRLRHL